MKPLIIKNKGKEILDTNYFDSELNINDKFYVSINAGAFRLLVPDKHVNEIKRELELAKEITITRKMFHKGNGIQGFEILIDDNSDYPFYLQLSENAFDRKPSSFNENKSFVFSAWYREKNEIKKMFESQCFYKRIHAKKW